MSKDNQLVQKRSEILNAFVCQETGHCCRIPGYVYVTKKNIRDMARTLKISPLQFREYFITRINGWDLISTPNFRQTCFLNEHNHCGVYAHRPLACRTYPDWNDLWQDDATLLKEAESCKGLAKAIAAINPNPN
jgi:uncharacterized protein